MSAYLIPLHVGYEKVINVFVHGYGVVGNQREFDKLARHILAARPAGRSYLMFWKSGAWAFPPWVLLVIRGARFVVRAGPATLSLDVAAEAATRIAHFKWSEHRAEEIGRRLIRHIAKVPHSREYPINLIGHSLGARAIHYALATTDWSRYRLEDVILLGGAADADDHDWPECAKKLRGRIYNAYSPTSDWMLPAKPDFRRAIGRHGIAWRHPKIVNRRYEFGHSDYWPNLEYMLGRLWPRFRQGKQSLLAREFECPYCGEALISEDTGPMTCPTCNLDCEWSGSTVYMIENNIACSGRGCGFSANILLDPRFTYTCPECDLELWSHGTIMR